MEQSLDGNCERRPFGGAARLAGHPLQERTRTCSIVAPFFCNILKYGVTLARSVPVFCWICHPHQHPSLAIKPCYPYYVIIQTKGIQCCTTATVECISHTQTHSSATRFEFAEATAQT